MEVCLHTSDLKLMFVLSVILCFTTVGIYIYKGRGTVEYLEKELERRITEEINSHIDEEDFDLPGYLTRSFMIIIASVCQCSITIMTDAFDSTGVSMSSAYLECDKASKAGVLSKLQTKSDISGATALSALLMRAKESEFPKALYVANCGDTRAILCEEIFELPGTYEARRLSYDHKATDPEEMNRIRQLGGSVKNGR